MSDVRLPRWRDYQPNDVFDQTTERPLDRIKQGYEKFVRALKDEEQKLSEEMKRLRAKQQPPYDVYWEWMNDLGFEFEELIKDVARLGLAFFLAGHSAYEVELVELAYGDPAAHKYSSDATQELQDKLSRVVCDPEDVNGESVRLKHLRDELAHRGGALAEGSPHRDAVKHYANSGYLAVEDRDGMSFIEFSSNGFSDLANQMNQVVTVARAAVNARET